MNYKIEGLYKWYNKKIVLDNFNYEFHEGLYILKGENGSGKSTLIKIIGNIIYPSYCKFKTKSYKISYLPEYIELSNGKAYSFLKSLKKLYHVKINIKEEMKKYELEDKKLSDLSQGNRKKVLLIGALMKKSDIYLFDEPINGLDKDTIKVFINEIKKLINNKIVIISTHNFECFTDFKYEVIEFV